MSLHEKLAIAGLAFAMMFDGAYADGRAHQGASHGPGMGAGHGRMEMMEHMHQMMGGHAGMMSGMHGAGMMFANDEDGDGIVTPDEIRSTLETLRAKYDANNDGVLSLDEFEVLHSALIRETMVDRFQHLDADGDGSVTEEEMLAPADQLEHMHAMHNRMMEGAGDAPGRMMPHHGRMMDDGVPPMQKKHCN